MHRDMAPNLRMLYITRSSRFMTGSCSPIPLALSVHAFPQLQ